MFAFKVIRRIESVEHVYIVMAADREMAKRNVAETNGWTSLDYNNAEHPWHPRYGMWSATQLTDGDGPFRLYEFDLKTGDMKL